MHDVPATLRISDTRVLRVPAATKVGMALSVERDATARPVHDRSRVGDGVDGRWVARKLVMGAPAFMTFCWSR
jgi:hypothetical protein